MFRNTARRLAQKLSEIWQRMPVDEDLLSGAEEDENTADDEFCPAVPDPVPAAVLRVEHEFDPIRMADVTNITFLLAEEREITLPTTGEGGVHVFPGDAGMLSWSGSVLIAFEKENGEVIGGMYYLPGGETDA